MENDKFVEKYFDPDDKMGFNEVLFERQQKIQVIRERLEGYKLPEKDINKAINIIIDAEMEMEKVKNSINYQKCSSEDIQNMYLKLKEITVRMKEDFDKKVNQMLKDNYLRAKKTVEKMEKNQPK